MIKYLGSKRRLVPLLGRLLAATSTQTALDLFTGTTRVAQEFKRRGATVTAVDRARYAEVFARCYVETCADAVDDRKLGDAIDHLNRLPGRDGYVSETFCRRSRFFRPENGARIDAIREEIEATYSGTALEPLLLTSLIEAADRVDSTAGIQMAYIKQWAPRSFRPLELRRPQLLTGPGRAVRGCALDLVAPGRLGGFDLAYLDPPYNQHRYEANYHIWETLVAWDAPAHYGVACKRTELREPGGRSPFNSRRTMPSALAQVVAGVDAGLLLLSYNDESWVSLDDLLDMCSSRGHVEVLAFDSKRYVGAQIGIHSPKGEKVGQVGRLRNVEYVLVAGERADVRRAVDAVNPNWRRSSPRVE